MKIFKICVFLSMMIYGLDLLRKLVVGQVDFVVEPKHIILVVVALVFYGIGGWLWITDKQDTNR